MTNFAPIAERLARALELMPCTCIELGAWPAFKPTKAHPVRTCFRCDALNAYKALKEKP